MASTSEDAEGWAGDSVLFKQHSLWAIGTANIPFVFLFTVSSFSFFSFFLKELHSRQKKTFFLGAEQRLKDWHNKEAIRRDAHRVGMEGGAECGHPVSVPWVCAGVLNVLGVSGPLVHFLPATHRPS